MAHALRFKLQALYGPRLLSSPALASKVLDPVHISSKCYGGSALLEDSCSSTLHNDIDGDQKVANGGGISARKGDMAEDKASKESNVDKLADSICDKLRAKANVARGENDTGFQGDSFPTTETKKADDNDVWQQVKSTVRSMVLKNKAKVAAGDKLAGVPPKAETNENEWNFLDPDVPEAGGEFGLFRGSNGSKKDSAPFTNVHGKSFKQKTGQSQFSHQQKPKDMKGALSFLNSLDDSTPLSSLTSPDEDSFSDSSEDLVSWDKKPLQTKDAAPAGAKVKTSKSKDAALPRAAEVSSTANIRNQSIGKDTTPGVSSFQAKRIDDTPLAQSHAKVPSFAKEATSQPSHHDNSVPRSGYMVCVLNLPSSCNPAMIKSVMANHGEVSGFFKKAVRNDYFNVYIDFKTEQAMEAALAARKLQIGSNSFLIARTDKVLSTVVRLCKVSNDTTEKQLLSLCEKFGSIDNIKKRINGIFDVFYHVKELPNMTKILGSLNEVTFNRSTWLAAPAPIAHPSVQSDIMKSPEGQAWHSIQVSQALNRIEMGMDGMIVLLEDLKELTALGKEFSKR